MGEELKHIANIPEYIFGSESIISLGGSSDVVGVAPVVQSWFAILLIAVVALYLVWVNHWSARGDNHKSLFRVFSYMRSDYTTHLGELTPSFNSYIHSGAVFGVLSFWVAIVALMDFAHGDNLPFAMMILAGVAVVYIYQLVLPYIIGVAIEDEDFFSIIRQFKNICFSVVGIVVVPTVLCYALTSGEVSKFFIYIIAFQAITVFAIYYIKTFMLFLSKKVSLLHTILYLCAVEIFPITLVWGFFCR